MRRKGWREKDAECGCLRHRLVHGRQRPAGTTVSSFFSRGSVYYYASASHVQFDYMRERDVRVYVCVCDWKFPDAKRR